jgi:hypothetical protein
LHDGERRKEISTLPYKQAGHLCQVQMRTLLHTIHSGGCANGFWHLSEEAVIRQVFADDSHFQDDPLMLPSDLDRVTPFQRLIIEQAFVLAKELENAVESAPKGQVVDRCESLLLGHGRDFLRRALESSLQSRAEALEKKGEPAESAPAERRVATRATRPGR